MKKKRDSQFLKLLQANVELIKLGEDLVSAILNYSWKNAFFGKSPHMETAVRNWQHNLLEYTKIEEGQNEK